MSVEHPDSNNSGFSISQEEWDRRILCSDGNCIGVIGSDGRCKECGKPYEGKAPIRTNEDSSEPQEISEVDETAAAADTAGTEAQSTQEDSRAPGEDWESRVLCSDGNCIGVIGPDGRCKECGKPYHEGS